MYVRTSLCLFATGLWMLVAARGTDPDQQLRVQVTASPPKLSFIKEPNNIHVNQDSRVRIRCRFQGLQPHHVVVWSKNNKTISRGEQLTGDRFTVDHNRYMIIGGYRKGYYDLRIWDVMRFDTGNYSCSVYGQAPSNSTEGGRGPLLLRSRTSKLTVYYTPPADYPECPVEMRYRDLQVGEIVPVCHSQKGNPVINLRLENPLDASRVSVDTDSVSDFVFVTLNVTESENGMTYWCKASSEDFPYYQSSCQVGPLRVVYKPRVVIRPLRYAIHEKEDAVFACEIESSPVPSRVEWSVYPPIEASRMKLYENNQTLQITNISSEDDGRLMSCVATNTQGNDTAHRVLVVRQPNLILPQFSMTTPPPKTHGDSAAKLDTVRPRHCYDSLYRILVATLGGVILLLIVAIIALLVRSRLWIFSKRLDEHSAQTEIMRPLTDYEIPPGMMLIDNKQTMLNIT